MIFDFFSKKINFLTFLFILVLFCYLIPPSYHQNTTQIVGTDTNLYPLEIPKGFPPPITKSDNPLTVESVALGKKLFFDPILSIDSTIACASCHHPDRGFSDTIALSRGVEGRLGTRNAPTLMNLAYHTAFMKDGGARTLALQVMIPLMDHAEMDFKMRKAVERLRQIPEYVELTQRSYGKKINSFTITRAIAAYERTLISGNSPFDYYYFHGEKEALTESQIRGWELFQSNKTNCSHCHSGFNFTSNGYENNGLYVEYKDEGRFLLTRDSSDMGKFKIPTLRNIALTAPYMHDGSLATLEEIISHYENGGKRHRNQNSKIGGFKLSEQERVDLIAFLEGLTDERFRAEYVR